MSAATNDHGNQGPTVAESGKTTAMGELVLVAVIVIGAAAAGWYFYLERATAGARSAEEAQAKQAEQSFRRGDPGRDGPPLKRRNHANLDPDRHGPAFQGSRSLRQGLGIFENTQR